MPTAPRDAAFATLRSSAREHALERELQESRALLASLNRQLAEETKRLAEARRQIGHSDKLRLLGQFVGGVVHDINNVLAVMQAATLLMKRRMPGGSGADFTAQAEQSVERGQRLVRQLLDFARPEGGEAEVFAPLAAIRADANLLAHLVGPTIRFVIDGDEDAWPVVAEPERLQTVLFNLVANARDACGEGGVVTLTVRNVRAAERSSGLPRRDYVRIAVEDNGSGMPPDVLARAGEPFFTTKAAGKGTGLGLASAFELADRCQGRVVIESAPGAGACVAIHLPRASALGEPVAVPEDPVDPSRHGGATVLIIDNEEMVRRHLTGLLRGLGYAVIEAANPDTALAGALGEVSVDLAICDLHLGSGSGTQIADRLRRDRPDLPFIFVTGSSGMGVPRGELVFRKPVSEAALARAVLERLGRLPASALTIEAIRRTDRVGGRIGDARIRALYEAWRARARDIGRLPSLDDARAMRSDEPDNSYVVEVVGDEDRPTFRFLEVGDALIRRLGRPLVGETVGAGDEEMLGAIGRAYKRCLGGVPYFDYARFRLGAGVSLRFERLVMPLTGDGERVSHLLGIATFEETRDAGGGQSHGGEL